MHYINKVGEYVMQQMPSEIKWLDLLHWDLVVTLLNLYSLKCFGIKPAGVCIFLIKTYNYTFFYLYPERWKRITLILNAVNGGDVTDCTSRGSCHEHQHLSMPFNLNQISIFISMRRKHRVRNCSDLSRFGCILAQMGFYPDPSKLPLNRGFLFTLFSTSHRDCQKKK